MFRFVDANNLRELVWKEKTDFFFEKQNFFLKKQIFVFNKTRRNNIGTIIIVCANFWVFAFNRIELMIINKKFQAFSFHFTCKIATKIVFLKFSNKNQTKHTPWCTQNGMLYKIKIFQNQNIPIDLPSEYKLRLNTKKQMVLYFVW